MPLKTTEAAPDNGVQILLRTASAISTLFPGISIASVPLSLLADHQPELAKLIPNFADLKHLTIAEVQAQQSAAIMQADPNSDTHL